MTATEAQVLVVVDDSDLESLQIARLRTVRRPEIGILYVSVLLARHSLCSYYDTSSPTRGASKGFRNRNRTMSMRLGEPLYQFVHIFKLIWI